MASLLDTENRIKSVDSTKKITKAMKLVATAKLRSAKNQYENSLKYAMSVENIVSILASSPDAKPYTTERTEGKDLFIVIGSELGLCGGYNANMFKRVEKRTDAVFIPLGKKAVSYFEHRPQFEVLFSKCDLTDKPNIKLVKEIGDLVFRLYNEKELKSVNLVYTKYLNSVSFQPELKQIFPIAVAPTDNYVKFETSEEEILESGLPRYVDASILVAIKESLVSEYASRRLAMDSATDNATELIDKLLVEKNRVRQAKITQEISEIVSGSDAL